MAPKRNSSENYGVPNEWGFTLLRLDDCDEIWLERFESEWGWTVAYRVEVQESGPVFAEMRILPGPPHHEYPGCPTGPVPRGGLTRRGVRDVPMGAHLNLLTSMAEGVTKNFPTVAVRLNELIEQHRLVEPAPPRPRGKSDLWFAQVAQAYVEAIQCGDRHPVDTVAQRFHEPPEAMRDYVQRARNRKGMLTESPGQGRPGGQLTNKALDILKEKP